MKTRDEEEDAEDSAIVLKQIMKIEIYSQKKKWVRQHKVMDCSKER